MPDKKIDEFYTIDTHKEMLDQIIVEKIWSSLLYINFIRKIDYSFLYYFCI